MATVIEEQNALAVKVLREQVAVLTEQVAVLSDAVTTQARMIQGVRNHNERLLDDVKNARRAAKAATAALAEERHRLSSRP